MTKVVVFLRSRTRLRVVVQRLIRLARKLRKPRRRTGLFLLPYSLIQHKDVLASVFRALKMIQIDISDVESSLLLSEYGERTPWSCSIPNMDFDPGDGHAFVLRINSLNSVDTSSVLEITFSWYHLICSNGMIFGTQGQPTATTAYPISRPGRHRRLAERAA